MPFAEMVSLGHIRKRLAYKAKELRHFSIGEKGEGGRDGGGEVKGKDGGKKGRKGKRKGKGVW